MEEWCFRITRRTRTQGTGDGKEWRELHWRLWVEIAVGNGNVLYTEPSRVTSPTQTESSPFSLELRKKSPHRPRKRKAGKKVDYREAKPSGQETLSGRVVDHRRKPFPDHKKSEGTKHAQRDEKIEVFGIGGEASIADLWQGVAAGNSNGMYA